MRFFIAKDAGLNVVGKQVFAGDESKADALVAAFLAQNPQLTVTEVDEATFNATAMVVSQTPAQKAWATFKAQLPAPTALQAIIFIAKYLGLE